MFEWRSIIWTKIYEYFVPFPISCTSSVHILLLLSSSSLLNSAVLRFKFYASDKSYKYSPDIMDIHITREWIGEISRPHGYRLHWKFPEIKQKYECGVSGPSDRVFFP